MKSFPWHCCAILAYINSPDGILKNKSTPQAPPLWSPWVETNTLIVSKNESPSAQSVCIRYRAGYSILALGTGTGNGNEHENMTSAHYITQEYGGTLDHVQHGSEHTFFLKTVMGGTFLHIVFTRYVPKFTRYPNLHTPLLFWVAAKGMYLILQSLGYGAAWRGVVE